MSIPSILIVGAGPTGATLALSLALNGVKVRLIEKDLGTKVGQRGAGVQPRTLEMHRLLGTLQDVKEFASSVALMHAYNPGNPKPVKTFDMLANSKQPSDAFPIVRALSLGQYKHVDILTRHLEKHGVSIELGTQLGSFEQDNTRVSAHLVHDREGVEETAYFDYIVGTDGAHSLIRKDLGLTFLGESRTEYLVVGDIYIHDGIDQNFCHLFGESSSVMMFLRPVGPKDPHLFAFVISGQRDAMDAITGRDKLIELIEKVTERSNFSFGELVWLSQYSPNIRMANAFRKGRVFIAGDAAHVHSPTGGQGLNSGVQDAFNLGWKLALVVKGIAKPELLDSYSDERVPVIASMLQLTSELHGRLFRKGVDPEAIWERGGTLDQLGVNYRGTPFVFDERAGGKIVIDPYGRERTGTLGAGDRAPDASSLVSTRGPSAPMHLYDILGATYHTILIFPAQQNDVASITEMISKYPRELVRTFALIPESSDVLSADDRSHVDAFVDEKGNARKAYNIDPNTTVTVAIRPDGVVGAIATSVDGLQQYFERIFK